MTTQPSMLSELPHPSRIPRRDLSDRSTRIYALHERVVVGWGLGRSRIWTGAKKRLVLSFGQPTLGRSSNLCGRVIRSVAVQVRDWRVMTHSMLRCTARRSRRWYSFRSSVEPQNNLDASGWTIVRGSYDGDSSSSASITASIWDLMSSGRVASRDCYQTLQEST